ncbi:hypothetical protein [Rhizobacter sp. Root16D2]|uniref:hypothetical protein n=1 Tax=Rhizobacter sp. Root16D2 TaxID=1736479 RepID=UPI0012F8936B|nr:hypothetical protein [Rhizobacter sp. Root16D2]
MGPFRFTTHTIEGPEPTVRSVEMRGAPVFSDYSDDGGTYAILAWTLVRGIGISQIINSFFWRLLERLPTRAYVDGSASLAIDEEVFNEYFVDLLGAADANFVIGGLLTKSANHGTPELLVFNTRSVVLEISFDELGTPSRLALAIRAPWISAASDFICAFNSCVDAQTSAHFLRKVLKTFHRGDIFDPNVEVDSFLEVAHAKVA